MHERTYLRIPIAAPLLLSVGWLVTGVFTPHAAPDGLSPLEWMFPPFIDGASYLLVALGFVMGSTFMTARELRRIWFLVPVVYALAVGAGSYAYYGGGWLTDYPVLMPYFAQMIDMQGGVWHSVGSVTLRAFFVAAPYAAAVLALDAAKRRWAPYPSEVVPPQPLLVRPTRARHWSSPPTSAPNLRVIRTGAGRVRSGPRYRPHPTEKRP